MSLLVYYSFGGFVHPNVAHRDPSFPEICYLPPAVHYLKLDLFPVGRVKPWVGVHEAAAIALLNLSQAGLNRTLISPDSGEGWQAGYTSSVVLSFLFTLQLKAV